jgi:plastocyanin
MKKAWVWIAAVLVAIVLAGSIWWFLTNKATAPAAPTIPDTTTSNNEVRSGTVNIDMKNTAFSLTSIKIKKGTKVVWTNQDSIQHNVVADSNNANGLPTENELIGKGQTYTFTFNTVGTVKYHCTPHPFMAATIEVVE